MKKISLKKNVLIVGAGFMANEYLKTLQILSVNYDLVGNRKKNVKNLEKKFKKTFYFGGIENFKSEKFYSHCVICVNEDKILKSIISVLNKGIKNILVEKPGGNSLKEIKKITNISKKYKAKIFIAYNRRFYESIFQVHKIIKKDKGIISADFSFTEWTDKIKKFNYKNEIYKKWFFFNSMHIIDLVFYLIGKPKELSSYSGYPLFPFKNSTFVGSGVSEKNIFFSYHSNWNSAGRWAINLYTRNKRIILSPLEKIYIQKKNSVNLKEIKFKKKFDHKYKPGLANLLIEFIFSRKKIILQSYPDYSKCFSIYEKIAKSLFK